MANRRNNADYTDFPKIFGGTYWGGFGFTYNEEREAIILNRNRFVADYNITRKEKDPPRLLGLHNPRYVCLPGMSTSIFDHSESYRNVFGDYVLIASPYAYDYPERDRKMTELGWEKIYPLYHSSATTYVKVVPRPLPRKNKDKLPLLQKLYKVLEDKNLDLFHLKYYARHYL